MHATYDLSMIHQIYLKREKRVSLNLLLPDHFLNGSCGSLMNALGESQYAEKVREGGRFKVKVESLNK